MSPESNERLAELVEAALECEPEKRRSFFDQECGDDCDFTNRG